MIEQGISRADRRLLLLPHLDLNSMEKRILEAVKNSENDVYLPELIPEARWARASLDGIVERVIGEHPGDIPTHLMHQEFSNELRTAFTRIIADPRGISLQEWRSLSTYYAIFNSFDGDTTPARSILEATQELRAGMRKQMNGDRLKLTDYASGGWLFLPTARTLDLSAINDWMAKGFMPGGLADKLVAYDGLTLRQPWDLYVHDYHAHWSNLGKRKTGLTINAEEMYELFKKLRDSPSSDSFWKKNLAVLWYDALHESRTAETDYSPKTVKKILMERYHSNFERLRVDFKANDVGDFYGGVYPSDESLRKAYDAIIKFISELERDYALP